MILLCIIMVNYPINTYKEIESKMFCSLPESTLEILKTLELELNISSNDKKDKLEYKKNRHKSQPNWEQLRDFKTTKIIDIKDEGDKLIHDIRNTLNKLSLKNMDSQYTTLKEKLDIIDIEAYKQNIINMFFDIVSSNKIYSEVYVELYKKIISDYDFMENQLNEFLMNYRESVVQIKNVDPDEDYDAYCAMNKKNDKRKNISNFIGYLTIHNVILKEEYLSIIRFFHELIIEKSKEADENSVVEELIENVYILMEFLREKIVLDKDVFDTLKNTLTFISKMKKEEPSTYVSMTMRGGFRILDIIDMLKFC